MNKIKLIYDIARIMKNQEKLGGILQVKVRKEQEEVFTLQNEFEKDFAGKGKMAVAMQLDLDGRHVSRQSTTEFDLPGGCCHGAGGLRRFFHGRQEECGGFKGFFSRLSLAFGVLNSISAEEGENGAAAVSLNLVDLPDEMRACLKEKMQQKAAHCSRHGFPECGEVESLQGRLVVSVNEGRRMEKITFKLEGSMQDAERGLLPITADGELLFAW